MRPPIFEILVGDVREQLALMPENSIHCIVTSFPYWNLRDYEGDPRQIGLEPTFDDYVKTCVEVGRALRRVLRKDGTFWLNIGKSYAGKRSFQGKGKEDGTDGVFGRRATRLGTLSAGSAPEGDDAFARRDVRQGGLGHDRDPAFKDQDLIMQGHLVAEALRKDGWYLRTDNAWWKNAMPESVTSRPANTHENVFQLTKTLDNYFDMEAVRVVHSMKPQRRGRISRLKDYEGEMGPHRAGEIHTIRDDPQVDGNPSGANLRTVWDEASSGDADEFLVALWAEFLEYAAERLTDLPDVWKISNESFPGKHFAVFSTKLVDRCVKMSTSERGCCPSCGAPWIRTVTKGEPDRPHQVACGSDANGVYEGTSTKGHDAVGVQDASAVKARILAGMRKRISTWDPGCACKDPRQSPLVVPYDPIPCLVLDPFGGSGRTGKAAVAIGRDAVLIELVPNYAEMARQNIADPEWERKERARIKVERKAVKNPLDPSVTMSSSEGVP